MYPFVARAAALLLLTSAAFALVPNGARSARITLTFTRVTGTSNDGYIDNIALVLFANGAFGQSDANLISNGTAETGTAAGWTTGGGSNMVSELYTTGGGFPTHAEDGPITRATRYFRGGNNLTVVTSQVVSLLSYTSAIDAGQQSYAFAAWIGGYQAENDRVQATLEWLDGGSTVIGATQTIGPVTNTDRANTTKLMPRNTGDFGAAAAGLVPPASRTAYVEMLSTRTGAGGEANGYLDDVKLKIDGSNVLDNSGAESSMTGWTGRGPLGTATFSTLAYLTAPGA